MSFALPLPEIYFCDARKPSPQHPAPGPHAFSLSSHRCRIQFWIPNPRKTAVCKRVWEWWEVGVSSLNHLFHGIFVTATPTETACKHALCKLGQFYFFPSNLYASPLTFRSCLLALAKSPALHWVKAVSVGVLDLFHLKILTSFQNSRLNIMSVGCLLWMLLNKLRKSPSIPTFQRIFLMHGCWILSNAISILTIWKCNFFSSLAYK